MIKQVALAAFRRSLPALVRQVERGTSIEITNRGRVVARLVAPANDMLGTAEALLALRPSRRGRAKKLNVSLAKNAHLTGLRT